MAANPYPHLIAAGIGHRAASAALRESLFASEPDPATLLAAVRDAGIALERIVADVGFGFGKTEAHNLTLLRRLAEFSDLGVPLLAGLSRKSTLGRITGRTVDDRLAASLAAALLAVQAGAKILRVHDVRETRDVLAVWDAVTNAPS